jgi:BTB/POZ domain-containing protein KCTD9
MEKKFQAFLDNAFAPYGNFPARADVTQELLANLQEKYADLKKQGKSDDEAYQATIDSFGHVAEMMKHIPHDEAKHQAGPDFRKAFAKFVRGAKASLTSKFKFTSLVQADLSGTDLSLADFSGSDLTEASFEGSNLTEAKFRMAALVGATFAGATLTGTDFSRSDLTGVSFDDQILEDVKFDSVSLTETSFRNATLRHVSFHYTDVGHAIFDGPKMDKVTYAMLKSAEATLNSITTL